MSASPHPDWLAVGSKDDGMPRVVDPSPPADLMTELLDRLLKADATLYQEMERSWEKERKAHLRSKAEGVRLAISYLEEMTRG